VKRNNLHHNYTFFKRFGSFLWVCMLHSVLYISHLVFHFCTVKDGVHLGIFQRLTFSLLLVAPRDSPPSLLFWSVLYVRVCCFFYRSKVQYLWISSGFCFLLPSLDFPDHEPEPQTWWFCFRFVEMQESAACL
jgi:hypothetical protein